MLNLFNEEIKAKEINAKKGDALQCFLEIASRMAITKNSDAVLSCFVKIEKQLRITTISEWLIADYDSNEENGCYEYCQSKVFKKLYGLNTHNNTLEKYPMVDIDIISNPWLNINNEQAQLMLTAYKCISSDEARYFMNGINFNAHNVVGTDGRCLFYSTGFDDFPDVILPDSKCIEWFLKKGTEIQYKIDKIFSVFQFKYKGVLFYYCIQNIEGQFPNWKKVIPENQTRTIGIPDLKAWKEIHNKIKQLPKGNDRIKISPLIDTDMVQVETDTLVIGQMQWDGFYDEKEIAIEKQQWEQIEDTPENPRKEFNPLTNLHINYKYFNDALMYSPLKEIQYTSFIKAISFIYMNGSVCIIMPMQQE